MMSQYFRLRSELSGAIAKRLPHAKIQLSVLGSFSNRYRNINIYEGQSKSFVVRECY